ncbi:MAG: Na+/H+ antiporter NhaC family protein [Anaerovoracaceae bacterium]
MSALIILIPIVLLIIVAVWSKDTFMSLVVGVITAYLILEKMNPIAAFNSFSDGLYEVVTDEGSQWVLILVALFGALIALLSDSGGVLGFSGLARKTLKTRKQTMIGTWILGIIIFVDDYLNCLAVGAATRDLCDEHKIPREMLAYIVNSTGVTVCAIIPFSTWGAFMGTQILGAGVDEGASVFSVYVQTMPFVLYGWLAVIAVPLFSLGIIPLFGPMKKAEQRALTTGEVFSPEAKAALIELPDEEKAMEGKPQRALNFLLPIAVVVFYTIWLEDIVIGLFAAILLCFIMYLPQKLVTVVGFFKSIMRGVVDMAPVIVIIIFAYVFMGAMTELGLVDIVIDAAMKSMSPILLPVTIFVVIGLLSFGTGSFWGLAMIAFPIVIPVAAALGVNLFVASGALISAVCFGGHICLYSDTVILTAASTQTTPVDYFRTSVPLVMVPFVVAAIGFLIVGLIM